MRRFYRQLFTNNFKWCKEVVTSYRINNAQKHNICVKFGLCTNITNLFIFIYTKKEVTMTLVIFLKRKPHFYTRKLKRKKLVNMEIGWCAICRWQFKCFGWKEFYNKNVKKRVYLTHHVSWNHLNKTVAVKRIFCTNYRQSSVEFCFNLTWFRRYSLQVR